LDRGSGVGKPFLPQGSEFEPQFIFRPKGREDIQQYPIDGLGLLIAVVDLLD
jgi:hypothetical protein